MKYNSGKHFLLILTVSLLFSCSGKKVSIPSDVIQIKQMEDIMTDVQIAEAAKQIANATDQTHRSINDYYDSIFINHHITKDQFERSFNFYKSHPELMEEIYTEVINRLNEIQAKPGNH
jgi:hypothetical protein